MLRGQLSLEFFFAMLLFLVFLLWASNYLNVASAGLGRVSLASQAKALAAGIAEVGTAVCLNGGQVSFQLACADKAGQSAAFSAWQETSPVVNISVPSEGIWASSVAGCPVTVRFFSSCNSSEAEWVCVKGQDNAAVITNGRC